MSSNLRLQRICQRCGNEFIAKTTVTKFCGDHCAKRAYKEKKREEKIGHSENETEDAGYNVMSDLLGLFIPAALKNKKTSKDEKVLKLIPSQFLSLIDSPYHNVLSILDYISGMTDSYATELYRKVFGIDIPKHK